MEIVQKKQEGVLFGREVNGKVVWFERSKRNVLEVKYKGQIGNNLPNAFGTSNFKGIIYEGDWLNGKSHGKGELILGSGKYKGDKYIGYFINGFKDGVGTYFHKNGSRYKGQLKKDKFHGKGVYTWSDGGKYVGEFKDGKKHGQGTYTFPSGKTGVGEFKGDKPWIITEYDKNGNIIRKWVNGVKQ